MSTRWNKFKKEYPEIYAYLSGQASTSKELGKRLANLMLIVDTVPHVEAIAPDAGKRALGTDTQADSVAAAPRIQPFTQPVDDSEATGKRYHYHLDCGNDKCLVRRGELPDSRSEVVAAFNDDDTGDIHAETCLEAIEAETRALREQNARLREELDKARQRVSELETRINQMQSRMDSIAETARLGLNASHSGIMEDAMKTIRKLAKNGVAVTIILL